MREKQIIRIIERADFCRFVRRYFLPGHHFYLQWSALSEDPWLWWTVNEMFGVMAEGAD